MAGIFGYSREAIRVKVKKCEGVLQPEYRKFSVDPQITSFEVLQSILAKAFDIKGDFTVCYRTFDDYGQETYLSLLSDWDLDAAFLSASEPNLSLQVDMKPFEESSEEWDVVGSMEVGVPRTQVPESKPQNRLPGLIMNQMERTLNMVQRALNLVEDQPVSNHPPRAPLTDAEFRKFLDPIGQVVQSRELRNVIYLGGIEPSLRKVVWKHLLNVYPEGMSGKERMDYMKKKAYDYQALRDCWKDRLQHGQVAGDLAYVTSMVRKDVLRTDRHHRFYAGSDDNQNIASLFNILTTYALNHPTVSYCQGMSDLASPLLVTMGDEAHAYICFCALMRRLHSNFLLDGVTMTLKFQHLSEGLLFYDPEFYAYLKSHQADDLLFCYRWLLLEMKREFAFEDALCMLEVLWSALPQQSCLQDLPLYELQFCPEDHDSLTPVSPLVKTPRENAYTKVCALRRQSSSVSLNSVASGATHRPGAGFSHRQIQSLDETGTRRPLPGRVKPFASLDDASIARPPSPFEVIAATDLDADLVLLKNARGKLSSLDKISSQDSEKEDIQASEKIQGRVVKNLNEFLSFKASNKNCVNEDASIHSNGAPKIELGVRTQSFLLQGTENDNTTLITKCSSTADENLLEITIEKKVDDLGSEIKCNDGSSPDDSTEYFPMTTSMTRELRLELENLDRQVFGPNFIQRNLGLEDSEDLESPVSESFRSVEVKVDAGGALHMCDCILSKQESELPSEETNTEVAEICSDPNHKPLVLRLDRPSWKLHSSSMSNDGAEPKLDCDNKANKVGVLLRLNRSPKRPTPGKAMSVGEEIFIWENPLQCPTTPDEQAELEYDADGMVTNSDNDATTSSAGEIFENEGQGVKSVTPIRLVRSTVPSGNCRLQADSFKSSMPSRPTGLNAFEKLSSVPRRVASRELSPGNAVKAMTNSCEEAKEALNAKPSVSPLANISPKRTLLVRQSSLVNTSVQLPPPHEFGAGNPFLMFLCLTVLRQHRDYIMRNAMDYNEMAMHFDKMVRKHNVTRVLNQARQMYDSYKKQAVVNNNTNAGLSV